MNAFQRVAAGPDVIIGGEVYLQSGEYYCKCPLFTMVIYLCNIHFIAVCNEIVLSVRTRVYVGGTNFYVVRQVFVHFCLFKCINYSR